MKTKTTKPTNKKVNFTLPAPAAQAVMVMGSFTNWQAAPVALKKQKSGVWKTTVPLTPGTYEYRFVVDGQWTNDPGNSTRVPNGLGDENCLLVVR
jgi:1,4-alpha-glucan branching enzyme